MCVYQVVTTVPLRGTRLGVRLTKKLRDICDVTSVPKFPNGRASCRAASGLTDRSALR